MNKPIGPHRAPVSDELKINEFIRSPKIRLIDKNGEMIGVISLREGLDQAQQAGLDLVEISPQGDPPVCKLLNYGKFRFENQKKKAAERKKQKIIEIKEIKMRPMIEINDYETKMRSAKKFIQAGDKVKFTMRFRGREMAHQDLGLKVFHRVIEEMAEMTKIELSPKPEGRQTIMILAPKI